MRFTLVAVVAVLYPLAAGAQSITSLGSLGNISGDTFALSATPQYAAPYSQVTVSLTSTSIDLQNATLVASVGGKQVYSGAVNAFPIQLGAAGSVTTVHAVVTSEGTTYARDLSLQPEDVTLIAEPIASAPPLYPGKPSVPLQGNVRLVAMADLRDAKGNVANPATDSYVWTVDDVEQLDGSGVGKSSIIVPSPLEYRDSTVSVVVTDPSGNIVGGDSLTLTAEDPTLRIYEDDPLLGIRFNHALSDSYSISGTEATLFAAPFSLPISNGAPALEWFLNGAAAQTGNTVTLRPAGSGQGTASLSVTATGDNSTTASNKLSLIFGAQPSSNFLGL